MKAIGYYRSFPISEIEALVDIEIFTPQASGRDLLIEVKAIGVNPIDTKIRRNVSPKEGIPKILGWDTAGIVVSVGPEVSLFKPGDEVWYAGDITRNGSNSEFHLVDERIVAKKPARLTFEEAAALPLTSLTAWELLFDRLKVNSNTRGILLITGAAGGVGSILTQIARNSTKLTIIGTASRPESVKWVLDHGAHYVINHKQELRPQLNRLKYNEVDYVISLTHSDEHVRALVDILKPQGQFALIDDPKTLDINLFKHKSISIHWEMMFTRSMYNTSDMIKQHEILKEMARLIDNQIIKTTISENMGKINASNLKKAHSLLESETCLGKIVLSGFD